MAQPVDAEGRARAGALVVRGTKAACVIAEELGAPSKTLYPWPASGRLRAEDQPVRPCKAGSRIAKRRTRSSKSDAPRGQRQEVNFRFIHDGQVGGDPVAHCRCTCAKACAWSSKSAP